MITLQLSEEEMNNLLTFLNRAQLTGQEADVLVMLKLKLRTAADGYREDVMRQKLEKETAD